MSINAIECPFCHGENTDELHEEWVDGLLCEDRKCLDCGETYIVWYDLIATDVCDRHNNPID